MAAGTLTKAQRAKARKQDKETLVMVPHCGSCTQRFVGQPRVEVVLTRGRNKGERVVVHETCFDPSKMEVV